MSTGPAERPTAYLFDIDGTLALHRGRGPFEYGRVDEDALNPPVADIAVALAAAGHGIVYLTGRPDSVRDATQTWLDRHALPLGPLLMRTHGDRRKDVVVKGELYRSHVVDRWRVLGVFEDRDQMVGFWRDEVGLVCLQVGPGAF